MKRTAIVFLLFLCQSIYSLDVGLLPFGGNVLFDVENGETPAYNFYIGLTEWSFENEYGLGIKYVPLEWSYSSIYGSRLSFINFELFYHFHLKRFGSGIRQDLLIFMPFFSINYLNISSIYEIPTMWNNITYSAGIRFMHGAILDYSILSNQYSIEAGYRSINRKNYIFVGMRFEIMGLAMLTLRIIRNEIK